MAVYDLLDDWKTTLALALVCRELHVVFAGLARPRVGRLRLGLKQAELRDAALGMAQGAPGVTNYHVLQAPMGFGKTLTALAVIVADASAAHRYLVIVPPKAYDTWVREAKKAFGPDATKLGSSTRILFACSSVKAHYTHVKRALEQALVPGSGSAPAFGRSVRAIVVSALTKLRLGGLYRWASRGIVDEAHATTKWLITGLGELPWLLLLSACDVAGFAGNAHFARHEAEAVSARYVAACIPVARVAHVAVAPYAGAAYDETWRYVASEARARAIQENLDEYVCALAAIFTEIAAGQVALYAPDGAAGDALIAAFEVYAAGWGAITFVRATSKLQQFAASERTVLVIRHAHSEAINLSASHMVVVRPDWVNRTRYAQIVGRGLRPTSARRELRVYLVAPRGLASARTVYYEACRQLLAEDVELAADELKPVDYRKADAALRLCGSALCDASASEAAAAMGAGFEAPGALAGAAAALLARWDAEERRTLTRTQMLTLLGLQAPGQ